MKRVFTGIAVVLIITICTVPVPVARAAHTTNFLDALYSEVTNRVANPGTNTARQNAALRAVSKILGRNTKTLSADVSALATAATVLNTRFEDDATILSLEESALTAYSIEAHRELDAAKVRVEGYSNALPRRVVNQFLQASNAVARFDANSNSVPSRARSLTQAFNKLRIPVMKILMMFPNPPPEAPDMIPTNLNIALLGPGNDPGTQTIYYFHTTRDGGATRELTYFCNHPPENSEANPGTWQYIKTAKATVIVRCTPNSISSPGLGVHDFTLIFDTTATGTFTGSNSAGQSIHGTFYID